LNLEMFVTWIVVALLTSGFISLVMKRGGYGRIWDVILGLAGSGAASTLVSALGAPSEAGKGAIAICRVRRRGLHHRAPAQDLAGANAQERGRNGREHQAIGPSSNGLRAPIAIRCYMRVDGDLQFTTSAVARAHHGG
jgi:uncharacterized membrane protein YeaQ/YmgE (transglycosylase-associated protein family)